MLLSATAAETLDLADLSGSTTGKQQSKVWQHDNTWFSVFSDSNSAKVFRLDGTTWNPVLDLAGGTYRADVKIDGDLAHVLLAKGGGSKLASLQYNPSENSYDLWDERPTLSSVPVDGSAETASIDIDSTGRMWISYDTSSSVIVRYSDGVYNSWSSPIVLEDNISSDDISALIALPNGTVGVLWSNQKTERFGFRIHVDGDPPSNWAADEIPAGEYAKNEGEGMADDHINLAVTSDATFYAAIKTSYNKSTSTTIGLLVRHPDGSWDNLHKVDTGGTRPAVQISETQSKIIVAYRNTNSSGPIVYRESNLNNISFGPKRVLINDRSPNNVSGSKANFTNELVLIAGGNNDLHGARLYFGPAENQPPSVTAGLARTIFVGQQINLEGHVVDDGLPEPSSVTTTWNVQEGDSSAVALGDSSALNSTVSFSKTGTYRLRLTANDGEFASSNEVIISVEPVPANQAPTVSTGSNQTVVLGQEVSLEGTVLDDGLPDSSTVNLTWSIVSQPEYGTTTISNSSELETSVDLSAVGTYVLRLTANDGELSAFDDITITVTPPVVVKTASFQNGENGYAGTRDTTIAANAPTTNYGSYLTLNMDGSPDAATLIRWDLSSVPTDAKLTAVSLSTTVTNRTNHNYKIYELTKP